MTEQHPITAPPELVQQWIDDLVFDPTEPYAQGIATRAAQWGWDQREPEIQAAADAEMEACVQTLKDQGWHNVAADLRAARRPKPPSAVAQAEALIDRHEDGWCPNPDQWQVIREGLAEGRRALESIDG